MLRITASPTDRTGCRVDSTVRALDRDNRGYLPETHRQNKIASFAKMVQAYRSGVICRRGAEGYFVTTILPFLKEAVFDPAATTSMSAAFDLACEGLPSDVSKIVKDAVAKCILSHAQQGERDPVRLCDVALKAVGIEKRPAA